MVLLVGFAHQRANPIAAADGHGRLVDDDREIAIEVLANAAGCSCSDSGDRGFRWETAGSRPR